MLSQSNLIAEAHPQKTSKKIQQATLKTVKMPMKIKLLKKQVERFNTRSDSCHIMLKTLVKSRETPLIQLKDIVYIQRCENNNVIHTHMTYAIESPMKI